MGAIMGSGAFHYEASNAWDQLPADVTVLDAPGVAVGADDTVYLLTRTVEHPVIVLSAEGAFERSFGAGTFSARAHGILVGPDGSLWCADDGTHTITHWSTDGELLGTIGTPNEPAKIWSGVPFNRPTHAAISPTTGAIYISDGYGNARMHKYSPEGEHLRSWGESGIDAGQFIRPHNVVVDAEDRVYVADRECHRVQVFDAEGNFLTMWNNIHRPDGMTLGPDGNVYIGELNGIPGVDDAPGLGHRVSILSRDGELLARLGDAEEGEEAGRFIAPHGIAVNSRGDIFVSEVAFTIRGRHFDPPRQYKVLKRLRKLP
jgi:DNA-binding beta-propeller fold protein YncE